MNIMGNVKKAINGASKIIIIPKKEKMPEPKTFVNETPEEYGLRLQRLRNRRY